MVNLLITGASGNVGREVIQALNKSGHGLKIYAGLRNPDQQSNLSSSDDIDIVRFDFKDQSSYEPALAGVDILFLLRPPQISEVQKYFIPIVEACRRQAVKHIVFLSVQGVEKSRIIPHHKIEKLIVESNIAYTFLRPAYFMQNFTTTLQHDLINKRQIFLPAGRAKFTLIDVRDIGSVAALIMTEIGNHINKSYELTSQEPLTFPEMAGRLSSSLDVEIRYISPNLIRFFVSEQKEGMPIVQILIMIMLHYFPRFQKEPEVSHTIKHLLGRDPITFDQFIADYKELLLKNATE